MQERLNWTVSKTVVAQVTVGSNPTLSVLLVDVIPFLNDYMALFCRSGRAKRNPTNHVECQKAHSTKHIWR